MTISFKWGAVYPSSTPITTWNTATVNCSHSSTSTPFFNSDWKLTYKEVTLSAGQRLLLKKANGTVLMDFVGPCIDATHTYIGPLS